MSGSPKPDRRAVLRSLIGLALAPIAALSPARAGAAGAVSVANGGKILIRLADLVRMPVGGRLMARVRIPETGAPVLGPEMEGPAHKLLWKLVFEGRAAGNAGDLYENRDRDHSRLPAASHPQLTHVYYDAPAREAGLDYGLAGPVIFDAPLIGNSSTAIGVGPLWRSQARLALTMPLGATLLYQNYLAGQMHVYPEHRDHDPEFGDLFPANTPFFLVSQGSSYTDRPHLEALAMILAALRPETKAYLIENQILSATVQMILRRSLIPVLSREAYLSGQAHPSVIPGDHLNLSRMVSLANAMTPETVPPMVRMVVVSETQGVEGVDFFGEGLSEALFDTPVAIARLWRSHVARRTMVVSAETTRDPQGRELRFLWRLLRGDPERTRIEPLDDRGLRARITVDWQSPRAVPGRPEILSNRIDIGVFAESGGFDSMPGLISIYLPQHETRVYAPGPDGVPRIASRDFRLAPGRYADPVLFPVAEWRDDYRHDASGALVGWDRTGPDGTLSFGADGRRITPDGPRRVRHKVEQDAKIGARIVLEESPD
ncbi:MAG: hypothetical protein EP307_00470 [Rhodobacteraceae bacterium]|nr:MAG: hypothetical protein EP307_00470 [Paracoccaceae bacterium]